MKKKLIIIGSIILLSIIIVSVYQHSIEEGRRQVQMEMQNEQQRQQDEAERKQKIEQLKNQLADTKAAITMANNELNSINSFHFLRTADEKEAQLSVQYKKIDNLKESLTQIDLALKELRY